MTELSPAAQAVLDAVVAASPRLQSKGASYKKSILIAAALRAAADQMSYAGADEAATWLTEIAAELEGQ